MRHAKQRSARPRWWGAMDSVVGFVGVFLIVGAVAAYLGAGTPLAPALGAVAALGAELLHYHFRRWRDRRHSQLSQADTASAAS